MTIIPTPDFSTDRPLTNSEHDCLNRAAFAKRIAHVLLGLPKGSGLIVGIHGPWGDGKTTVLNMLRTALSTHDFIVVRDFNPWRITNDDAMFRGFFSMLADAIKASLSTTFERATSGAAKWFARLRLITKPVGLAFKPAESLDDLLAKLGEVVRSGDSVGLEELRNRIIARLEQSAKRIVVLIDDLDRLDKDETHTLFRLVKACADFPSVCFVLAFDEIAVAKSLGERYGGGDEQGRAFLEKIIQVPLKLPVAAKEDLRSLCFEHVDRALTAAGIELTRKQIGEFVSGFDRGVSLRLNTPRAAKRYGNGLLFALPMLKGEINPVDLLLVEALRAFFPEIYDIVRSNHADFSGLERQKHGGSADAARAAILLKPIMDAMQKDEVVAVKALLIDLFPRVEKIYNNFGYDTSYLSHWASKKKISSPSYCHRYFTYTLQRNDISDSLILDLLNAAAQCNATSVDDWFLLNFTASNAPRLIEKLRGVEEKIDPMAAKTLALTIARQGADIPNPPTLWVGPPSQAAILISHLLRRITDRSERMAIAKRVIQAADPLWFGAECVRWLHVTDSPEKQDRNTLTTEEERAVRDVLVERIKAYAATGAPLFDPNLPQESNLLYEWWRAEGREPVQTHLLGVFAREPKHVAKFLQSKAPLAWGDKDVEPHVGEICANTLKNIKLIINLDVMAEWVRNHCPGDFENPQWRSDDDQPLDQRLAEQFMFVYNKWMREGEPPDVQFDNNRSGDNQPAQGDDGTH